MRRFATGLLILVSSLCLFLSSTSLWVRHNVINTGVFVGNVETIVDLPQVRSRVTDQVTTTVMTNPRVQEAIDSAVGALPPGLQQFKPTVTNGVQTLVATGVRRLLDSEPFRPLVRSALTTAHGQLVNGQPVRFTLGQAKARVPASAQGGLAGQVLGLLPDDVGITVLTPADAPRVYNAIDVLKSVWWWVGLVALATLAGALGISHRRRRTLRAWAVVTSVLAFLLLIVLRVARGWVLTQAKPVNRDALGAVYGALAGSLRAWTIWLLVIALVVLVETLVWGRLRLVAAVRHAGHAAREQVRERREARALAASSPTRTVVDGEAADGAAQGEAEPVRPAESWPARVALGTRAFVEGLGLRERSARLGAFVDAHFGPARWIGIVVGALVLLLWPSPTLSVLIWTVALVALWIGALEWLRNQAPERERTPGTEPDAATGADGGAIREASPAGATVPAPRAAAVAEHAVTTPLPGKDEIAVLTDRMDLLTRLGTAHDAGVLTDEEYAREKGRLLQL